MAESHSEIPSRAFKGIWIPREIWLHKELDPFEKLLWAEIDSLDDPERGCTASNLYFQKFFNINERPLQTALAKLKRLGLIRTQAYDGRIRTLRSSLKSTYEKFDTSEVKKSSPHTRKNFHPSSIGEFIDPDIKEDNKEDKIPPSPLKKATPQDLIKGLMDYLLKEGFKEEEVKWALKKLTETGKKPSKSLRGYIRAMIVDERARSQENGLKNDLSEKHMLQALIYDGRKINGDTVCALRDRVEFSCGSQVWSVQYALSEEEWNESTKRWFK